MNQETILYVLLGFLLLLVILAVPLLIQLWRAAAQMAVALRTLNERLPLILRNLEEISGNVNGATRLVSARVDELSFAFQRINTMLNAVLNVEQIVRSKVSGPVPRLVHNAKPLAKGAYAFWRALNRNPGNQG